MGSSDNPTGDYVDLSGDDDFVTPTSKNKDKRKEKVGEEEGDSNSKKKKKTTSWVWKHFTKQKNNKDKCNCHYCHKELSCPSKSGTSTMRKHLEGACKAYQVWQSANKESTQTVLTPDGSVGTMKVSKVSFDVFREAVNEMLVLGELPLAFVESVAFRHFCSKVQLYVPHSRRTATRDIVEYYVNKKEIMRQILGNKNQRCSLTTDIWVAPITKASYMEITAHFVDATWQLRKMIIGFKNVEDHKGSTICKVLLDCLAEWNIKRVFCITVDNATANSSAITKFKEVMKRNGEDTMVLKGEFLHLRCATHILNLVVREGLDEVDYSVDAIRNGIQFVRSSTNRLKSFDFRVETGKIKRGSLPLDVKTRWNSTYLMLEQALKFRSAFEKMEAEDKPYSDYFLEKVDGKKRTGPPLKVDWDTIERLVQVLVTFYNSTLVLSASTYVASHKLFNEIVNVTRNIMALSTGSDLELRSKALSMLAKLGKYWDVFGEKVEMNKLVIVATVFDPRKKMKFAKLCFDMLYGKDSVETTHLCDVVYDILKALYDEYSRASNSGASGSVISTQSQVPYSQFQEVGSDFRERTVMESVESIYDELVKETGMQNPSNELDLYLKENVETPVLIKGSEYDILSYWKINSGKFPVLALIAKDILAMQVSSVASESAFSTSGRILDPHRSCLSHYMIEVLMCTEQWLKSEVHLNEKGVSTIQQLLADVELEDELRREFEPAFNMMQE